jgi:predicted MFS family arabinose efflux permease
VIYQDVSYTMGIDQTSDGTSYNLDWHKLTHLVGMFTGRALDSGFFHWVVVPGMLLSALGIFFTSLCNTYWQFFLAQGVMNGMGNGCQFAPTISLVSTYFARNRSAALAVMACGSAIGGLLYPTIVRQLLPQIGFQWTLRVMGFIMLAVGAVYTSLLRPRLPPRKSGPLFELSAFREVPYTLYAIGLFLVCLGVYFAFYYISAYAVNVIGVSYGTSINLILIINGMGLPGRLIPGYIANRWLGPYNTLIPLTFIASLLMFCWAAVETKASLYAFTILYGFFSAGFQGLFPTVMANLTKDLSKVGTRNGMGLSVVGFASLTGPPIAGALIQSRGGDYVAAQMWAGSMMLLGSLTILAGRLYITGWKVKERV